MTLIQNQNHINVNVTGSSNSMINLNPLFRSESFGSASGYYSHHHNYYPDQQHNYTMMEKRQLFLRSYQFSRKKSLSERIKGSFIRVKKVVWLRLRSARRLRRRLGFSVFRIKCGGLYYRSINHHKYRKSDSCSCVSVSGRLITTHHS